MQRDSHRSDPSSAVLLVNTKGQQTEAFFTLAAAVMAATLQVSLPLAMDKVSASIHEA